MILRNSESSHTRNNLQVDGATTQCYTSWLKWHGGQAVIAQTAIARWASSGLGIYLRCCLYWRRMGETHANILIYPKLTNFITNVKTVLLNAAVLVSIWMNLLKVVWIRIHWDKKNVYNFLFLFFCLFTCLIVLFLCLYFRTFVSQFVFLYVFQFIFWFVFFVCFLFVCVFVYSCVYSCFLKCLFAFFWLFVFFCLWLCIFVCFSFSFVMFSVSCFFFVCFLFFLWNLKAHGLVFYYVSSDIISFGLKVIGL